MKAWKRTVERDRNCAYSDELVHVGRVKITVSATKLGNNIFDCQDGEPVGETFAVQLVNREVARLFPIKQSDWRDKMSAIDSAAKRNLGGLRLKKRMFTYWIHKL